MIDLLDSGGLRALGYLVLAAVAAAWGWSEHRHPAARRRDWWPTYWWTSAALLAALAAARVGSLGDLITELGRERARTGGWYEFRRNLQAIVVIALGGAWFVGVVVAVWRVPPRRRRYLPHAVGVSGLVVFAAVRVVSLHHVDTLLYRRDLAGVRVVAVIELSLLVGTLAAGVVAARLRTIEPAVARETPGR